MNLLFTAYCTVFSLLLMGQHRQEAVIRFYTIFNNLEGQPVATGKLRQWQRDSTFIQQAFTYKSVTDAQNKTTVEYIPGIYRFINLKTSTYYDYKQFSKTATCIKKSKLPEGNFKDAGWVFYSDKNIQVSGTPEILTDTTINNQVFKRAKFRTRGFDSLKTYAIAFFPVGRPFSVLSLEKKFSKSQNWFLSKLLDYENGAKFPYAITEIEFLADKLTKKENEIFDAWENYAQKHPVKPQ